MKIDIQPLQREQLDTLTNLMQLYLYDFSVYLCDSPFDQINEEGVYDLEYSLERYLDEEKYWAYLCRVDDQLAGFALISARSHHRETAGRMVDEFFVLRCYRRKGVGRRMATLIFDTYSGYWEIAQIPENKPAQAFWRRVIRAYTKGRFEEIKEKEGDVWQVFDSSTWR